MYIIKVLEIAPNGEMQETFRSEKKTMSKAFDVVLELEAEAKKEIEEYYGTHYSSICSTKSISRENSYVITFLFDDGNMILITFYFEN